MSHLIIAGGEGFFQELFGPFGINKQFFIAQCINFFLVLFVLKKFAFGPIQAMLEQRKQRIAEGEEKLKRIENQLAESEEVTAKTLAEANANAKRMIDEAKESAGAFAEQKNQEAIASAQNILAKAEEAAKAERNQVMAELKRDFGRLVASTTAGVTGKVLTEDDNRRLNEETMASLDN